MQAPRGTRDFGPLEMAQRRSLEAKMRAVFRVFNYREVQTPTFEEIELFLAKSGPGIREEIYNFTDKSDRELALRPELTAPVMRFYFANLKMEPKPLRLFYFGPCFRYDRPQAGRYREFWQMGCELVGDDTPEAHAELLHLALRLFEEAGLQKFQLRIGHLGILRGWLERLGFPRDQQGTLMRLIDKKDMPGLEAALAGAKKAKPHEYEKFLSLFAMTRLDEIGQIAGGDPVGHLQRIWTNLQLFGVDMSKVRIDPTISRGLEYYTGLVFELDAPDLGAEKQLLGGGAYDLSGVFEQPPVAAVGFALGFDRTLVGLEKAGGEVKIEERVDAYVAALDPKGHDASRKIAMELRRRGYRVELEAVPVALKRMLARASQLRAKAAVFVGAKEAERGVAAIKVLDNGVQTELPVPDVGSRFAQLL